MNKTGDIVSIRGYGAFEFRLTGASNDGIVQFKDKTDKLVTTSATEIAYNYTEAARLRGKNDLGMTDAEYEAQALADPAFRESLMAALQQSADGDVRSLGDFSQYK